METSKFIKTLRDRYYDVETGNNNDIYIRSLGGAVLAYASGQYRGIFSIEENAVAMLNDEERMWLVDFVSEYSKTPPDMRKIKDKKYYLRYRWFSCSSARFLCYDKMIKGYYLRDLPKPTENASCLKMLFTKQEIESIKGRFSTILDDYEILEVKDENE